MTVNVDTGKIDKECKLNRSYGCCGCVHYYDGCIVWTGYHSPPIKKSHGGYVPPSDDYEAFKRNQIYVPAEKFPSITFRNKPKKCRIIIEVED